MTTKRVATSTNVLQQLRANRNEGLTMLQTAIKISSDSGVPCLPSDLTQVFTELESKGLIKRDGTRKNPLLKGKRISRSANVFKIK